MPLVGFNSSITYALGTINLPVMAKGIFVMENFVVVNALAHYKLILGRPWIHKMNLVPSIYDQVIKYPTEDGVMEIR